MKKTLILLILAVCSLMTAKGQQVEIVTSANLRCDDTLRIYSPKASDIYDFMGNEKNLPTLFLLHGWSGCWRNWGDKFDLQAISDETGFRIICPDGFYNSWYVDSIYEEGMQYRKFFWEELYPELDKKYGLDPAKTFITGLSMGGHGAINIYLDHPECFRGAGSMSGVLNLLHTNLIDSQVSKVLGPFKENKERYEAESAVNRLKAYSENMTEADKSKLLLISCGYEDRYAVSTREFCERCETLGIPYIQTLAPATHSWKFWGFALEQQLHIFGKVLKGGNLGK